MFVTVTSEGDPSKKSFKILSVKNRRRSPDLVSHKEHPFKNLLQFNAAILNLKVSFSAEIILMSGINGFWSFINIFILYLKNSHEYKMHHVNNQLTSTTAN